MSDEEDESEEASESNSVSESESSVRSSQTFSSKQRSVEKVQSINPLDALDDIQLVKQVEDLENEYRYTKIENHIFIKFLQENDPASLDNLEAYMDPDRKAKKDKRLKTKYASAISVSLRSEFSLEMRNLQRVNLTVKIDLVVRMMEDMKTDLEEFKKKVHIKKCKIIASLEEMAVRLTELTGAADYFENYVVSEGFERLTQRIPAEKFLKFMDDWLKSAQTTTEKLRLRKNSLKIQIKKLLWMLAQRQELGENVHPVDFDKLSIENKNFTIKIEQKNGHLMELKKMNGNANLILSTHKKILQKQLEKYNKLNREIHQKRTKIESLENERIEVTKGISKVKERYMYYKNMKTNYKIPDIMVYVNTKAKLWEIDKNIKICERRKNIQDSSLNACIREMKNVTGSQTINPAWFEEIDDVADGLFFSDLNKVHNMTNTTN